MASTTLWYGPLKTQKKKKTQNDNGTAESISTNLNRAENGTLLQTAKQWSVIYLIKNQTFLLFFLTPVVKKTLFRQNYEKNYVCQQFGKKVFI